MDYTAAYQTLFSTACYVLAACLVCVLIRAVRGPRVADRIVAVNMVGTDVILAIAIIAVAQNEDYLADICFIYAMLSFLSVLVLSKVYTGVYLERHRKAADRREEDRRGR